MFQPDECKRSVSRLPISPRPINPILVVRLLSVFLGMNPYAIPSIRGSFSRRSSNVSIHQASDPLRQTRCFGNLNLCICNWRARMRVPQRHVEDSICMKTRALGGLRLHRPSRQRRQSDTCRPAVTHLQANAGWDGQTGRPGCNLGGRGSMS